MALETDAERAEVRRRIPKDRLVEEPGLIGLKWYPYRYLSALEATRRFQQEYLNAYRHFAPSFGSVGDPRHLAPLRGEADIFKNDLRSFGSLWRARQAADAAGIGYEFFNMRAMELLRGGNYRRVPRPNQLYSDTAIDGVLKQWHERRQVQFAPETIDDVRLLAQNFRKDPPQVALEDELVARLLRDPSRLEEKLTDVLYIHPWVRRSVAEKVFGAAVVRRAKPASAGWSVPTAGSLAPYRPSCYGYIGPLKGSNVCEKCRFRALCSRTASEVVELMSIRYLSADPLAARKRRLARERQRRRRYKKKQLDSR